MQLVVGLGNPGDKYKSNRHNTGFMVLEELINKISTESLVFDYQKKFDSEVILYKNLLFAKPQTFMNSSGKAAKKLVDFYKINTSNLWIIHDDLDIKLGQYKIQNGTGPKLHNGIESIENLTGKKDFWRVRVGVDNRSETERTPGEDYVLQDFSEDERKTLSEVTERVSIELIGILSISIK